MGTATVGSGTKPIYLSSGTPTASGSTVGSGTKPIYMSSGALTASSSSVGASGKPVYLNAGTITACSVNKIIQTVYFSIDAVTIGAGETYEATVECAVDNYKLIGVVGWNINGNSSTYAIMKRFRVDSTANSTIGYQLRNTLSSEVSWGIELYGLYIYNG